MRKVVLWMSVSVDGYFAGPDDDLSWLRVDEELHRHFNYVLSTMGMFLDGRVTWELMAAYWPTADQDPGASRTTREFARIWREKPKAVWSRTMQEAGWNTTVYNDFRPEDVHALKEMQGADLVLGGAFLADKFMQHGLVDEVRLYVHPVVLGRGRPLFTEPRDDLRLIDSKAFGSGVVLLRYAVRRPAGDGPRPAGRR